MTKIANIPATTSTDTIIALCHPHLSLIVPPSYSLPIYDVRDRYSDGQIFSMLRESRTAFPALWWRVTQVNIEGFYGTPEDFRGRAGLSGNPVLTSIPDSRANESPGEYHNHTQEPSVRIRTGPSITTITEDMLNV